MEFACAGSLGVLPTHTQREIASMYILYADYVTLLHHNTLPFTVNRKLQLKCLLAITETFKTTIHHNTRKVQIVSPFC